MLMNPLKAINSGWHVQIQADVTFNVCMEDVALIGFGVNSMGAKYNLCVLSLIPKSIENKKVYSETWMAVNAASHLLLHHYGYAGYNSTVTNNGAESTWHHIKDIVKSNGTARINVFIKSLFAHLQFKGEETYTTQRFKYWFPVHPEASPETWRNVQRWRSELLEVAGLNI